jgi:hypothetical protein
VQLDHLYVGARFDPQVGFVRRRDMVKDLALFRFSPRSSSGRHVRKWIYQGTVTHVDNTAGRLESRAVEGRFGIDFQSGDTFVATVADAYEFLPAPFTLAPGVRLPVGGYDFTHGTAAVTFGRHRTLSGGLSVDTGSFYDGRKTTWGVSSGRYSVTPRVAVEPGISVNQVRVSAGEFVTTLATTRFTVMMSPLMFASGLVQYNSASNTLATNVRFRWEYSPGSELFVVYNDQRETLAATLPGLLNRSVIVKITRLFRF